MAPHNIPWFERDDFEAMRRLLPDMPEFAGTFEDWLQGADQRVAEFEARGDRVVKVIVKPKDYVEWCARCGLDYDFASLGAFVVSRNRD